MQRFFVNRRRHQSLHLTRFQVTACTFQGGLRCFVRFRRSSTHGYRKVIGIAGDEVQTTVFCLLGRIDDIPSDITIVFAQGLNMLFRYGGITVHHRTHDLKHIAVQQRFDDHFVSHAVCITGRYCYYRFHKSKIKIPRYGPSRTSVEIGHICFSLHPDSPARSHTAPFCPPESHRDP